jgi:hypothetical protein
VNKFTQKPKAERPADLKLLLSFKICQKKRKTERIIHYAFSFSFFALKNYKFGITVRSHERGTG